MEMPRIRVAGILIKEGKMLFVKHRKNDKEYYLLPGGGVDYGEGFAEALEREYMEEVNLKVKTKDMLFVSEAIAPDKSKHIVNMFFEVEYVEGKIKLTEEERLVGVEYLDINELDNYTIYPNIKNELKALDLTGEVSIKYLGRIWE